MTLGYIFITAGTGDRKLERHRQLREGGVKGQLSGAFRPCNDDKHFDKERGDI